MGSQARDKDYAEIKKLINSITSIKTFNTVLEDCRLSDEEKQLLKLKYLENKDLTFIADELHVSYATIKRWHKKAIKVFIKELQSD